MTYENWLRDRTYSVIRHHRGADGTWEKVEATGLRWESAQGWCNHLEKLERAAHPNQTSWTRDLFIPRLEAS